MNTKRKNNIKVYGVKSIDNNSRREELLNEIIKSDTNLPDSILHNDLDLGMLEYCKKYFKITSDDEEIPIIPKILTIQRWSEISNNWNNMDESNNMKIPFIAIIRKPDVQLGNNKFYTIPERRTFFYKTVKTWDGNQMNSEIYKIPMPVPVEIKYDVTIVCTKIKDLNNFNRIILQKFTSRQSYTNIKGHYIPILLESISDSTPNDLESRRFYIQTYNFLLQGVLLDSNEFEVQPSLNKFVLMNELSTTPNKPKKINLYDEEIFALNINGINNQTTINIGESIGELHSVSKNGIILSKDVDFYHVTYTPKITLVVPLTTNDVITIIYFKKKKNSTFIKDENSLTTTVELQTYNGFTNYITLNHDIVKILSLTNGENLVQDVDYVISDLRKITFINEPQVGTNIIITYQY